MDSHPLISTVWLIFSDEKRAAFFTVTDKKDQEHVVRVGMREDPHQIANEIDPHWTHLRQSFPWEMISWLEASPHKIVGLVEMKGEILTERRD